VLYYKKPDKFSPLFGKLMHSPIYQTYNLLTGDPVEKISGVFYLLLIVNIFKQKKKVCLLLVTIMADILTVVGENIKYYRTKLGMTQVELAEQAGINRSYLASLERGRRNTTLKTVEALAKALGVSTSELVSSSDALPEDNS
jgi:DNA-binding XRE family transcriptional regulator